MDEAGLLTVAVTGPTGTFGFGLMPLLEAEPRIASVVGIARRPFDPLEHGWGKMTYRQGDVRDQAVLAEAFAGADVVVHLAFLITGSAGLEAARAINLDGTDQSGYVVAVDTVGAGFHEKVIVVGGSSARMAEGNKDCPVDSAIIGVIDTIDFIQQQ